MNLPKRKIIGLWILYVKFNWTLIFWFSLCSVCEITDNPITYRLLKDDIEKTLTPFDVAVKLFTNLYGKSSWLFVRDVNCCITSPALEAGKSEKGTRFDPESKPFEILFGLRFFFAWGRSCIWRSFRSHFVLKPAGTSRFPRDPHISKMFVQFVVVLDGTDHTKIFFREEE